MESLLEFEELGELFKLSYKDKDLPYLSSVPPVLLAFHYCFPFLRTVVPYMLAVFVFIRRFRERWQRFRQFPVFAGHSFLWFDNFCSGLQGYANKLCTRLHKAWWIWSILRKSSKKRECLGPAFAIALKPVVQRTLWVHFHKYASDEVVRCVPEYARFLQFNKEYFR